MTAHKMKVANFDPAQTSFVVQRALHDDEEDEDEDKGRRASFVASTATLDRLGDIVEQDWDLKSFRKNPIILFDHDSSMPIGTAERIEVEEIKGKTSLVADILLAGKGTSPDADKVAGLLDERILRAVSVGFMPGQVDEIRDADGDFKGFRFSQNVLHEISIVAVPGNEDATRIRCIDKKLSPEFIARLISSDNRVSARPRIGQLKRQIIGMKISKSRASERPHRTFA